MPIQNQCVGANAPLQIYEFVFLFFWQQPCDQWSWTFNCSQLEMYAVAPVVTSYHSHKVTNPTHFYLQLILNHFEGGGQHCSTSWRTWSAQTHPMPFHQKRSPLHVKTHNPTVNGVRTGSGFRCRRAESCEQEHTLFRQQKPTDARHCVDTPSQSKSANAQTVTIILYKHNNIPREIKHGINAYQ
jgi:hypothetical protein